MPYTYYLVLRRDAYVAALRKTESGRRYLEDAHRLTRTDFDAASMRSRFS